MNGALITSLPGVLAVCTGLIAFALWGANKPVLKKLGPAMICIIGAMILSNVNILPKSHDVYDFMGGTMINLSIAILLLDTDLKKMRELSFQPFAAMLIACAVVCVITFLGGIVFAPGIGPEGWKAAGMFVGTYTGGSTNLNAIAIGLETSADIVGAANTADYVIYTPFIIFIMWAGSSLGAIPAFNKFWPHAVAEKDLKVEGGSGYLKAKEWSIIDIAIIITIGFAIVGVSTFLASLFPSSIVSLIRVILITTIAIILAQFQFIKKLKGIADLGLYTTLFFLVDIGVEIDLVAFANSAVSIAILCAIAVFGSLIIHCLLCRLFKIKWQFTLLSMQAAIGSSSSAAALAAASGWETLIGVGVVLGVFGQAVGNYIGFAVAYAVKAVAGM